MCCPYCSPFSNDNEMRDPDRIGATLPDEKKIKVTKRVEQLLVVLQATLEKDHVGAARRITKANLSKKLDELQPGAGFIKLETSGRRKPMVDTNLISHLIGRHVPVCLYSEGKSKDRGIFIAQTSKEIEEAVNYRLRQAAGARNSALALLKLRPYNGGVSGTENLDTPQQPVANTEESACVSDRETVKQTDPLTHLQTTENT